jgi:2-polyprenyl-3-methyl-5-hydroxy-6-metoxy-1,4-benzoquinol methylase
MPDRTRARELAAQFNANSDPLGWFDALYREAESGVSEIPWADLVPNPNLLDFWKLYPQDTRNKSALIIGSGLGDDAEQLSAWGFQTTAFDISATAIAVTKKRFPTTKVQYVPADLLAPPKSWRAKFAEFSRAGLHEVSFEDYLDPHDPGVRKFRATYRRQ